MARRNHPDHPPRALPDQVADAAIKAAERFAEDNGVEIDQLYLALTLKGLPEGAEDSSSAGSGFEDAADLLAYQMSHVTAVAREAGVKLDFVYPELN